MLFYGNIRINVIYIFYYSMVSLSSSINRGGGGVSLVCVEGKGFSLWAV